MIYIFAIFYWIFIYFIFNDSMLSYLINGIKDEFSIKTISYIYYGFGVLLFYNSCFMLILLKFSSKFQQKPIPVHTANAIINFGIFTYFTRFPLSIPIVDTGNNFCELHHCSIYIDLISTFIGIFIFGYIAKESVRKIKNILAKNKNK